MTGLTIQYNYDSHITVNFVGMHIWQLNVNNKLFPNCFVMELA